MKIIIDKPVGFTESTYEKFIPLSINLNLSKSILINQFEEILNILKEKLNTTHEKRYQKMDFEIWHKYAVLPYIDLKLWEVENNTSITNRTMADAIHFESSRGEENLRKTRAKTASMLLIDESLNELAGQAFFELMQ